MVKEKGQSLTEFLLVMAILTGIGLLLVNLMTGTNGSPGGANAMATNASNKIVADQD